MDGGSFVRGNSMQILRLAMVFGLAGPVYADGSLGITGASASLGYAQDELGVWQVEAAAAVVDVAVTAAHGVQLGLRYADTVSGAAGAVEGHVYLSPNDSQKYGLFVTLRDLDGRALRWGTFGGEGIVSLGLDTVAEVRAGIGYADDGLDFIFAGAGLARAVSDNLLLEAALDLADFDEPGLRALSYEASVRANYHPDGAAFGGYISLTQSGFSGPDEMDGETRIGVGISLEIGSVGGADVGSRIFRGNDPVAPLLRRGIW